MWLKIPLFIKIVSSLSALIKKWNRLGIRLIEPLCWVRSLLRILGLTKYTANYWPKKNIRCNLLAPGGIKTNQPLKFRKKLNKLIPLGRMAKINEYEETILYMISDASSYMNGSSLIIDGGRTSLWKKF